MGKESAENKFSLFEKFSGYLKEYGKLGTLANLLWFLVAGIIIYFAFNPNLLFDRYDKYITTKHNASTEYRIENAPKVTSDLNQLAHELKADKAFIMEYHNGKSNPSGLQWQYGDMTFLNDEAEDITDEYQNVSLVKYKFANKLYNENFYFSSVDDIKKFDKRLALRLEASDIKYMGAIMLYSTDMTSIGFLGVSYKDSVITVPKSTIETTLTKYSVAITPLLDGTRVKQKY